MAAIRDLNKYTAILGEILNQYCDILNRDSKDVVSKVIVSATQDRYLVITEGWDRERRVHDLVFDAEIHNDKIWLHHDGLDHGIVEDLLEKGISKGQIVLAFHPPHIRQHTDYAVA